ncbi:hypothetical protein [Candidatus Kuenenia stuttgartiensis]|uniref:hypothetical protein n=1 Tax=Kuenenia stuttgartiensis TaxID=174633 RepID=UPI0012FF4874|nr:hypothetical protein [Candidatus Kuenenia stuttgartiensis]
MISPLLGGVEGWVKMNAVGSLSFKTQPNLTLTGLSLAWKIELLFRGKHFEKWTGFLIFGGIMALLGFLGTAELPRDRFSAETNDEPG